MGVISNQVIIPQLTQKLLLLAVFIEGLNQKRNNFLSFFFLKSMLKGQEDKHAGKSIVFDDGGYPSQILDWKIEVGYSEGFDDDIKILVISSVFEEISDELVVFCGVVA